jgi:Flp pilus assembly protein TadD
MLPTQKPSSLVKRIQKRFALIGMIVALFCPALCRAQGSGGIDFSGSGGIDSINGRIYFPSGRRTDVHLKISLEGSNVGTRIIFADLNGSFSFRNLEPGRYTITIDGGKEYETTTESVNIDDLRTRATGGHGPPPRAYYLPIYLRLKSAERRELGVVDARLSSVPAAARDLYEKALVEEKSNPAKAIEDLKRAVSLYPSFALALNELGIQYLKLARIDDAIASLRAAIKVAPDEFGPRLNYGIALLNQKKFEDAESQLRIALQKNESAPTAHMYLGIVLAVQRKLREAEKELLIAISSKSTEISLAHRFLGGVYLEAHDYKRAADELDIYLKLVPDAPDAEQTRAKIKEYRHENE